MCAYIPANHAEAGDRGDCGRHGATKLLCWNKMEMELGRDSGGSEWPPKVREMGRVWGVVDACQWPKLPLPTWRYAASTSGTARGARHP